MTDLDRRFDRVERGLLSPDRDPVAGLADRIRAARGEKIEQPPWMATPEGIMERSAQVRAALQQQGRY